MINKVNATIKIDVEMSKEDFEKFQIALNFLNNRDWDTGSLDQYISYITSSINFSISLDRKKDFTFSETFMGVQSISIESAGWIEK